LLAGLQHAELGVDRAQVGDQPLRVRLGPLLGRTGLVPSGPATTQLGTVVHCVPLWTVAPSLELGVDIVIVESLALGSAGPSRHVTSPAERERVIVRTHGWSP